MGPKSQREGGGELSAEVEQKDQFFFKAFPKVLTCLMGSKASSKQKYLPKEINHLFDYGCVLSNLGALWGARGNDYVILECSHNQEQNHPGIW